MMNLPTSVAVDPSSGKVFVADQINHRVLRFASAATLTSGAAAEGVLGQANFTIINLPSIASATGMNTPSGVAVDSSGRLWVADTGNNRVLRFDGAAAKANGAAADGVLGGPDFTTISLPLFPSANRMSMPNGLTVDSSGRLWVADTGNHRVLRFDSAAAKANGANANGVLGQPNFTTITIAILPSAGTLNAPRGVTADSSGNLWVADTNNNRVLRSTALRRRRMAPTLMAYLVSPTSLRSACPYSQPTPT